MRTVLTSLAAAAAGALVLTGCGGAGGADEYGTEKRAVTVDSGDEFTLKVPANPALGQNWYLAEPRPDANILKYRGKREEEEGGGSDSIGSGDGTQYFDFTALKSGKATVKLLHCPMASCHSGTESAAPFPNATAPGTTTMSPFPTATGTPDDLPAFFVYTITVR
ncbi:protease inhibitor I42 family protein [Streptomyces sp. Ag109_G2-15]|uniref:protease inhibitor I42 family protein n=1 Tax=Streptomyces sp. Ag109_G2-15 TaxID=1938850 RepID=UPI000BD35B3C|nr:protease inhibitor I42 family protein [Streptomyces sp. Ag109_G2-15]SOD85826.1 Chagasin family peptidase inhibitor I42 [Streptomyces sp. Ag109_G2-15]